MRSYSQALALALVSLSGAAAAAAPPPPMTLYKLDAATYPRALAIDGSMGAFYFVPGDTDDWVFEMQGGGWCVSLEACYYRSLGSLGSSANLSATLAASTEGLLARDCAKSPLCAVNHVFLPYLDGNSFSGMRAEAADYVDAHGAHHALYFRGREILAAVIDSVRRNVMGAARRLADAQNVGITGGSAGGLATILHADFVASLVNDAKGLVWAAPQSGYFMDLESVGSGTFLYGAEMGEVFALSNASTNAACAAKFPDFPAACQLAEIVYPLVTTPMFLLQSMVDSWQTRCILAAMPVAPASGYESYNCSAAPGWAACSLNISACSAAQVSGSVVPYGRAVAKSVLNISAAKSNAPGNGGFLDSCHTHVEAGGSLFSSVTIGGVTMQQAFAAWLADNIAHGGTAPAAPHWHKDCEYGGPAMCNPTCPDSLGCELLLLT